MVALGPSLLDTCRGKLFVNYCARMTQPQTVRPMSDDHDIRQRELLDAVWNDYDNNAPRLAYADWLDTQEDPAESARAECIRLSVRWAHRAEMSRVLELQRKYATAWLAGMPGELASYEPRFVRGMFEATVTLTARELLASGDRWFRRAPLDVAFTIHLRGEPPKKASKLPPVDWLAFFGKPWWERVIGFVLLWGGVGDALEASRALAANPAFHRLRSLDLHRCQIGDEGATALAASPYLANLLTLNLSECNLTGSAVLTLARRENMPNLKTLFLGITTTTTAEWGAVQAVLPPKGRIMTYDNVGTIYFDGQGSFPEGGTVNDYVPGDNDIPF
jgi:uncharacterized protein (TIGR02996 family)